MAKADFQITLRGGVFEGDWQRFAPGEIIEGTVQVLPLEPIKCNHVWLRLQWHTEGRGDRDEGRIEALDLAQGELTPQTPITQNFRFTLPREPWSYAEHYINIIWEIVAEIDIPLAPDVRRSQLFILAPHVWQGKPPGGGPA